MSHTGTPPTLSPDQAHAAAKALAAQHGFPLAGIALVPPDGLTPRAEAFAAWLDQGFHGPLAYMQRTQAERARIRTRFPWVRSVLALGTSYDGAPRGKPGRDLVAHVARYARGRDYHLVLEKRLKKLSLALAQAGVCSRAHWCVDTAPVLERAWAEAAGLGWIGKNACLIAPRLGSFFLLAEIPMDSAPQPDRPVASRCGTCRRCLEACPSGALVAPGVLDARRCLATWNIERRGETPPELWPAQREWVFGCDTCQAVCPHNQPATKHALPSPPRGEGRDERSESGVRGLRYAPDAELAAPRPWHRLTLADCITLTQTEFNRVFVASPLRRAGLKGLRLSAITVAGNMKLEDCREALRQCLTDDDNDIRRRAVWALGGQ